MLLIHSICLCTLFPHERIFLYTREFFRRTNQLHVMEFAGMEFDLLAHGQQDNRLVHVITEEDNSCPRSSRSFLGLRLRLSASRRRLLPNTLLKKVIWLPSVTADMSELRVIEAGSVPSLHYRTASMIQRSQAAAASATMKVFASIAGNTESRASL